MTRRRFYAPPEAFGADDKTATLTAEETRHLRNVLRLKSGDEVHLFDGAGREYQCRIQSVRRDSTEVKLIAEVEPASPESSLDLTLAVALLKGEKFDLVVQKATELGVTRIIPVTTSRADVRLKNVEDAERKTTRWQRIALEATKQCGRASLMKIERPAELVELFKTSEQNTGLRLMFAERGGELFKNAWAATPETASKVTALVGLEGGWTDDEIGEARTAGWKIVTLGGRILRAETAAIVIATLLEHRFGDLA